MWDETKLTELLEQKKQRFLEYEQITNEMLFCDSDNLEERMGERVRLIHAIDRLDEAVKAVCDDAGEEGAMLRQAVRANGERGALPAAMRAVFDQTIEIRAVISRLPDLDQQLEMRLCQERDSVLEQIKSANRGQGAQAARYYGGMGQQQHPQGFQFGNA